MRVSLRSMPPGRVPGVLGEGPGGSWVRLLMVSWCDPNGLWVRVQPVYPLWRLHRSPAGPTRAQGPWVCSSHTSSAGG
ncbi:hypothetical protein HMPREF1868_02084 [Olsenella sp. DNF00959]|nr:hypothetical protein HMPREF1868_02084 [Olsenella sp. DNF00959]